MKWHLTLGTRTYGITVGTQPIKTPAFTALASVTYTRGRDRDIVHTQRFERMVRTENQNIDALVDPLLCEAERAAAAGNQEHAQSLVYLAVGVARSVR